MCGVPRKPDATDCHNDIPRRRMLDGDPQRAAEDINAGSNGQTILPGADPARRRRSRSQLLALRRKCDIGRGLIPLAKVRGSLGQILVQQGAIDAAALTDALAHQSGRHPLASELYMLGYASERQLCTALSAQTGWPGIVLHESGV